MNKQSYYKEITLQRYAQQKARPLTPDSLLRKYAYPTEVFYGKTKQEFIDNNGEASNTHDLGRASEGRASQGRASEGRASEGRASQGRVPLVLEPQVLTQNITPDYAIEHGVIKGKNLKGKNPRANGANGNDEVLRDLVIGVYHWEFPLGKPLDDPRDYLFSYTLTEEIVKPNPKAMNSDDSFEYYHIEIR
jgi:hypothetical protein